MYVSLHVEDSLKGFSYSRSKRQFSVFVQCVGGFENLVVNQCCDYFLFILTVILALRELRARDWDETKCGARFNRGQTN